MKRIKDLVELNDELKVKVEELKGDKGELMKEQ